MIKYRSDIEPLVPYVPGKPSEKVKEEFGLSEVVKLASNENVYGCSPAAKNAAADALSSAETYPDGSCGQLRKAVSKKYNIPENRIIFGCGTDEIISMLGKVFIEPNDEILLPEITFPQYAASAVAMGGKPVFVPQKDFRADVEKIVKYVKCKDKIQAVFIANPNNPTGTYITAEEEKFLIENIPPDVILVLDEAYAEYVTAADYPDSFSYLNRENVIIMKTFSKIYGLAGLRVGFAFADANVVAHFEKIRSPFNVSSVAQAAAIAALADDDFIKMSKTKNHEVYEFFVSKASEAGFYCIPSQANFVMVDVKKDSRKVFESLMKKGFIVRPGAAFGMDTFLRVTLGTIEQMENFFPLLMKAVEEL